MGGSLALRVPKKAYILCINPNYKSLYSYILCINPYILSYILAKYISRYIAVCKQGLWYIRVCLLMQCIETEYIREYIPCGLSGSSTGALSAR
jgi:hypothetical protein